MKKVVWKVTLVSILVMIGILCGNNSFAEDTTYASWTWYGGGEDFDNLLEVHVEYNEWIDWGDGSGETIYSSNYSYSSHRYAVAGVYTCKIRSDYITQLNFYTGGLSSLDLSGCTSLCNLVCCDGELSSLDLSDCPSLYNLGCDDNNLSSLDVSSCTSLETLSCDGNNLSSLDVSSCTSLETLSCDGNNLSSLDVSSCTSLRSLSCDDNNLSSLELSDCTSLRSLSCDGNNLSSLDVSSCTSLETLSCDDNQLITLDVTANTSLKKLSCVQQTLNELSLTQQQVETMDILDKLESCTTTPNGEIHKFANTKISVDGVVCTEHTGGTTENDGKCTVCGVKYIGVKYYVILDNGFVRTIFSSFPGKLIRVGFTDGSAAEFMVNTGNVTLEASGNYRTFMMPSENVDITISK